MKYKGKFFSAIRTSDFYGDVDATTDGNNFIIDFECKGSIAHGQSFHAELQNGIGEFEIKIQKNTGNLINGTYHDKDQIDCGWFELTKV